MKNNQFLIFNGPATGAGKPWYTIKNQDDTTKPVEILIYDQIGKDWWDNSGVSAKDFVEELKAIPMDREIRVCINSPGGNVFDGLTIYNLLNLRKDKVTTRVDGVAASIASVIVLAGHKVEMPSNALIMIHDPSTFAMGTTADMQRAIDALNAVKNSIIDVYKVKTGKTDEEISQKMTTETWFSAQEAKDFGFVDEITNEVTIQNNFDFSSFKRAPEAFRKSPQNNGATTQPAIMNREKIIALLKKHGAIVNENATLEQLEAQLDQVLAAKGSAGGASQPSDDYTNRLKAIEARYENERRTRITQEIDNHIAERRIVASQRDNWITRAMADETILADIRNMPSQLPGDEPVVITGEAPGDVAKGVLKLTEPMNSFARGNEVKPDAIRNASLERSRVIKANMKKLLPILNAHSIDAGLKQSVIMVEGLEAYKKRLVSLGAFSTRFNNVPLLGTDKVEVPYYPLFTTASTDFVQANGYEFAENSTTSAKELTINKRKYQPFQFNSSTMARQPFFDVKRLFNRQVEQLGVDVWTDILSVVTLANFGAAAKVSAAAAFDKDDVLDLSGTAESNDWPEAGRALVVGTDYRVNIAKGLTDVAATGSDSALREGIVGRVGSFDVYSSPRIPANAENLVGFICLPSAILVATSPIMPAPGVQKMLVKYDVVIDPDTGIAFEYRYWGDADMDEDREVVECNYGYLKGEAAALKRITSA